MNDRKRILIVDDDADFLEFARTALERAGFEAITALDGLAAMATARSRPPDLIILDIMMPEQDGWDTCDRLRSFRETSKVPIVLLTNLESPRTLYMSHGAFETDWDEYLNKPVTAKELVSAARKVLRIGDGRLPTSESRVSATGRRE